MIPVLKDVLRSRGARAPPSRCARAGRHRLRRCGLGTPRAPSSRGSIRSPGRRSGSRPTPSVVNITPPAPSRTTSSSHPGTSRRFAMPCSWSTSAAASSRRSRTPSRSVAAASLDLRDGDEDPHLWLDPVRFSRAVAEIAEELDAADAAELLAELEELDAEYRRGLADCERDVIVTTHAAFGHLAAPLRADRALARRALAGGRAEPTRARGARRKTSARPARRRCSPSHSSRTRSPRRSPERRISWSQTLDPVEGLSEERLDAGEDYLSVMRANLDALREALGCR